MTKNTKSNEPEVQTPDEETQERAEIYSGDAPEPAKVKEGDAGTYTGEYKAVPQPKPETRKDLPRGYVAGNYVGDYSTGGLTNKN